MNILMIAPLSVGLVNGGLRMQSTRTAQYLEELSVHVTRFTPWDLNRINEFDLVHVFLASPETYQAASFVHRSGVPLVLSPVTYTRHTPLLVNLKRRAERLISPVFQGHVSGLSLKASMFKMADRLLPNTEDESNLLQKGFGIPENRIDVVPNGVDQRFAEASPDLFYKKYGTKSFVLFVGDASAPRKNVLSLLKASKVIDRNLVIIGPLNNSKYAEKCRELIRENDRVLHIHGLDHDDPLLDSAYAAAHTFVLPSYYETPGIAALEAVLAGCRIAITNKGGTKEYFGDDAVYLDPGSTESIQKAIQASLHKPVPKTLKKHIIKNYTWQKVAEKTVAAYKKTIAT